MKVDHEVNEKLIKDVALKIRIQLVSYMLRNCSFNLHFDQYTKFKIALHVRLMPIVGFSFLVTQNFNMQ